MRRVLAILAVVILSLSARAGNVLWWGRNSVVIYPSGDGTITNWTHTGGGSYFTEIDDPVNAANLPNGDGDTTNITAPHNLNCSAIFDLTNDATYAAADTKIRLLSVMVQGEKVNDAGSGVTGVTFNVSWRIASADYSLGTAQVTSGTSAGTYVAFTAVGRSYLNPATGLPWTAADVDALQLKVTKTTTTNRFDGRITAIAVAVAYDRVADSVPSTRLHGGGS